MEGEISGSVCNCSKDKLSNKPEQIQVLRILFVGVEVKEQEKLLTPWPSVWI